MASKKKVIWNLIYTKGGIIHRMKEMIWSCSTLHAAASFANFVCWEEGWCYLEQIKKRSLYHRGYSLMICGEGEEVFGAGEEGSIGNVFNKCPGERI